MENYMNNVSSSTIDLELSNIAIVMEALTS